MNPPPPPSPRPFPNTPPPPPKRADALFAALLDLPAEDRERALAQACAGNDALAAEVRALLAAHDAAGDFMKATAPLSPEMEAELARLKPEETGERIGPYKLLQEIGEGGFGTVWMAEQMEPVKRRVALKIIKMGMDTREVVARFEQERQALAMMDHPNIAKVFDAGATQWGRPFFVMELVRGVPITAYCDGQKLSVPERLALFIDVCHAIQHAHQKGIIHRDLKPSNILVTAGDGDAPVPKVIDFGVAKAMDRTLTDKTLFTQFEQMIGTPAYMSPEQAGAGPMDIDTRSDIYALGVLLYEMLTGKPPFDPQALMRAGHDEMRRVIREEDPPKPSTRLSTLQKIDLTTVATSRHSEAAKLTSLVRGDLDWIVMKALEKNRNRRYDTANAFADDIQRHLASEPVIARPPSTAYLLQKLVHRHRTAFAAGSAVVLALLAGIAVSSWQAVRATRAEHAAGEERAKAVSERDRARTAEREAKEQRQLADLARVEAERNHYAVSMNLAQTAWDQANIGRLRGILEETRTYPDRGFEWYYWQRQAHSEVRTLHGHLGSVHTAAFSPDGRRIVTSGMNSDGTVKVWDAETCRELLSFYAHREGASCVAFSPDSRRIATVGYSDWRVKVWDGQTGRKLLSFRGDPGHVAFSPDGQHILTGSGVWDAETGREVRTFEPGTVAITADGRRIAVRRHNTATITIRDTETDRELLTLPSDSTVAFTPDGQRIITGSSDGTAKVWEVETGRELFTLKRYSNAVSFVGVSPDGQWLVTLGSDATIRLWDAQNGRELRTFKGLAPFAAFSFSSDCRWIVGGGDGGNAKVWDARADGEFTTLPGSKDARSLTISSDGRRIAASVGDSAKVWDIETSRELLTVKDAIPAAFAHDGLRVYANRKDGGIRIFNAETGRDFFTIPGEKYFDHPFSLDGSRLATRRYRDDRGYPELNDTWNVWDVETGRELASVKGRETALSPDGRRTVTVSYDGKLKISDAETGRDLLTLTRNAARRWIVGFSADGRRVFTRGPLDKFATIWDAGTGRELFKLDGHADRLTSIAFAPNGKRILTGSADSTAKLWDAQTGRELLTFKVGDAPSYGGVRVAISDQRVFAREKGGSVKVWLAASFDETEAWRKEDQAEKQRRERRLVAKGSLSALEDAIFRENWEEAAIKLADAETAQELFPEEMRSALEFPRFRVRWELKDYPAAYKLAEAMSDANLDDGSLQRDLAGTIADTEGVEPRALVLAEKFATRATEAFEQKDSACLATLARVLFLEGKKDEAVQTQERAVSVAEDNRKAEFQKTLDSYRQGILPKP